MPTHSTAVVHVTVKILIPAQAYPAYLIVTDRRVLQQLCQVVDQLFLALLECAVRRRLLHESALLCWPAEGVQQVK